MRQLQVVDDVHKLAMNKRNDTSVNPKPVDMQDYVQMGAGPYKGCVDFVYKVSQEMGGALFSPQNDPVIPDWARFFGFNRIVSFPTFSQIGRDEFDVKWTLAGGLQINTSNQINWSENGMWQVDPYDPPKWMDSGFRPVLDSLDDNSTHEFMFRCSTDGATIWNIDTLACDKVSFSLPDSCKKLPLKKTNWTSWKAHFQEQAEGTNVPCYVIKRYHRTQILMSDSPIPLGWF